MDMNKRPDTMERIQTIEQANALDGTSVPANTMLLIPM